MTQINRFFISTTRAETPKRQCEGKQTQHDPLAFYRIVQPCIVPGSLGPSLHMSGVFTWWRHIGDATLPASGVRCLFSRRGRDFFSFPYLEWSV